MLESITLNELIAQLQRIKQTRNLTGDEKVVSCSDYGDHNHTMQAIQLGTVETCKVGTTSYSESGYKVVEGNPADFSGSQVVVCLNYPDF